MSTTITMKQGADGMFAAAGVDQHQPAPELRPEQPAIQDLVIADIEARKLVGLERYGTLLKAHNGRDALMDAYQEALDLCQYLRQAIEERNASVTPAVHTAEPTGD